MYDIFRKMFQLDSNVASDSTAHRLKIAKELLAGWEIERAKGNPQALREIKRLEADILALQRQRTDRYR